VPRWYTVEDEELIFAPRKAENLDPSSYAIIHNHPAHQIIAEGESNKSRY